MSTLNLFLVIALTIGSWVYAAAALIGHFSGNIKPRQFFYTHVPLLAATATYWVFVVVVIIAQPSYHTETMPVILGICACVGLLAWRYVHRNALLKGWVVPLMGHWCVPRGDVTVHCLQEGEKLLYFRHYNQGDEHPLLWTFQSADWVEVLLGSGESVEVLDLHTHEPIKVHNRHGRAVLKYPVQANYDRVFEPATL